MPSAHLIIQLADDPDSPSGAAGLGIGQPHLEARLQPRDLSLQHIRDLVLACKLAGRRNKRKIQL